MTDPNRHLRTGQNSPWPKGKPRNPPTADWLALRRKIKRLLRAHQPGKVSYGAIATHCGVIRGTVRRWFLSRTDPRAANPSSESVAAMKAWVENNF